MKMVITLKRLYLVPHSDSVLMGTTTKMPLDASNCCTLNSIFLGGQEPKRALHIKNKNKRQTLK